MTPAESIRSQTLVLVETARRLRLTREDIEHAIDLAWSTNEEEK